MIGSDWFLLGAPWDCSGSNRGEERAPAALRAAGLTGLVDVDLGDAATLISGGHRDETTGVLALPETVAAAHALADALRAGLRDHPGRRPLLLGGDCSLLLGVFIAVRDTGLWLVDGHPDYVEPKVSDTGETADSELAILTGHGPAALAGKAPMVAPGHVALIGHRTTGLDAGSAAELARLPADLFTLDARTVLDDPHATGTRAATWADRLDRPMWLHVDLDVLDPSVFPAVTYPQPAGPDLNQLAALLSPLARSPALRGVSVADFRPDLDPDGRYAKMLIDLLTRVL